MSANRLLSPLFASIGFIASAAAAQEYSITDFGSFGGRLEVSAVNDAGAACGTAWFSDGSTCHAFLWEDGLLTDLGTLGGSNSYATSLDGSGRVVGYSDLSGDLTHHAFVWEAGVMTDLGTLGGLSSAARDINDAGVIVGESTLEGDEDHGLAFRWESGEMTNLGSLFDSSSAAAVNESGQIVGTSFLSGAGYWRAFLWDQGVMTDLGTLGGPVSQAFDIDDAGRIVGQAYLDDTNGHGFLWDGGVMTDLGSPTSQNSYALSINAAGQIVGGFFSGFLQRRAVLWDGGAPVDLNSQLLLDSGFSLLVQAHSINDSSEIVGSALSTCRSASFLMTQRPVADCRVGNVGGAAWRARVVFVNGNAGDSLQRRMTVTAGAAATIKVNPAPDRLGRGQYALWVYEGESSGCVDIQFQRRSGALFTIGRADRCLPVNNSVTPETCECPTTTLFGPGFPGGATSRTIGSAYSTLLCLGHDARFTPSPVNLSVVFPVGTFTIYSVHADPQSANSPAFNASVGNTIVVESLP